MNRKVLKAGLLVVFSIMLCGCPYESEFPLSSPDTAQIDRELIGNWKYGAPGETEAATLSIYPFNDHEIIIMSPEGNRKIVAYRAFATCIQGEHFLNVQEIGPSGDAGHWLFVGYSIAGNRLTIRILEDTLMNNRDLETPEALSEFIGENLKDKDLFGGDSEMVFERL
ncbi:MAG: hypothetical protein ACOYVJ_05175 [Nitrospirota bacterium]